jgi:ATP-dependent DNA helicase RecG
MRDVSVRYIKGVGPRKEAVFKAAGVYTVRDLLYYFPFRYEDRTNLKDIKDLIPGEYVFTRGRVLSTHLKPIAFFRRSSKVKSIFEIILEDKTGRVRCVWFNQHYLADTIKSGDRLAVYGKFYRSKNGLQIVSPEYERDTEGDSLGLGRIVGIYRLPSTLTQRFMRNTLSAALSAHSKDYADPIPFYIRQEKDLSNVARSFEGMHFPSSWQQIQSARQRFIFEELFFSQVSVYLRKARHRLQKGPQLTVRESELAKIKRNMAFTLTVSQERVLSHILRDLAKPRPMHRLLQGDVACGKTVVAALAMAVCADSGFQAALLVPTEVLAYQHKETLESLFRGLDFLSSGPDKAMGIITSSLSRKDKERIQAGLKNAKIKIIVGTHALLQEKIGFEKLGLVVIDEQHRFGVAQRALLPKKGVLAPHCLVMSATPIPRTLALSLYGDLDLSVITDMPKGRVPPETIWVEQKRRRWVYDFLEKELSQGRQAYIIYPVIEEIQDEDLKSLKAMYAKIAERFGDYSVGMFHGRLKPERKIRIIKEFRDKKIHILVSTTVVEVGVNIENATVMVVENPERFGLAQLHQLRGRIQRASFKSYFIFISGANLSPAARKRLEVISKENSGFVIAEADLNLRGPGDFFGNLQHGLPDLKVANPLRDLELLQEARFCAYRVIKSDPLLAKSQHRSIRNHIYA